ncbi:calcium-activated chloride channel regulator 3A-1-like isoform X1 [Crassostrea angulata]|uniref:calcium-activated chloride channel regulator 3A-1-like isoform X1 n=1 Tax=Magallana angulata TaxID=2784310 RepID=UPI0022B1DFAA|nr:calcium-activated chloride channel regulator 3A-1-like isoform X1 [Crassostrea angulata]
MKFLYLLLIFVVTLQHSAGTHIRIKNNGYELVVVAIHESVKENAQMLTSLKKIITDSSKVLYSATRHRAYFRKVFFLIPSTWSSGLADKDSTSVNLRDADIIISDPSSVSRRSYPRTRSYAGCGHRGIHIQLRTDVLFNSRHPLVQGKPEKYLVHEFAKYWYGVFEEYPNPGENQFYFSTTVGRADPVRCTTGLRGRIMKKTQSGIQLCSYDSIDPDTGEFPEGCVYYPYPSHNQGTASMMDHSYIQEIKDFCDDDQTPGHFSHNVEPPNRQNRLCSHRSTWDIISNTPDFLNNANPPGSLSDSQLTPQFIVFRAPSRRRRRLAVVLDPPQEFHKRLRLHQAVDHFLTEGFDDYTKVALITNAAHRKGTRMRSRRSAAVKSSLQSIDHFYSLSTMQSQIRRGIEILKKSNSTKEGMEFHLIVISCNNQSGFETEVLQEMATTGITPHFIHCGENGIDNMKETRLQGGHAESRNQRSIFYAVQRLSDKLHDEKDVSVQISNDNIELDGDTAYHSEFSLDDSLRGELTIRLHYSTSEPSVQVVAPNGSECVYKSTDRKLRYIRLTSLVSHNEQGKWSITIKNKAPNKESINVLVMLQSIILEDEVPIRTNAWVKLFHEHSPPRVGVYAEVMNGGHPVVNANVTAHVYHEDRKVAVIPLRDSGGGFDIMKNDGIYSNSFTEIESQGRHYVEVMIEDVLTNSEIHRTYEIQLPTEKDTEDDQHDLHAPRLDYRTEKIPLRHRLKRSTSSGEFHVDYRWDSLSGGYDYPPARINDLTVTRVNRKDRKVSLSWTATGSDLDNGRASSYEIRYNTNGTALVLNPKKGMLVKEDMLGDTSGKPKEAGQVETVTVQFPTKMKWVAIMLRSIDENNNAGEFSNMVTTYFVL